MSEARPSPFTAPALRAIILRDDNDKLIVQASKKEISAFAQPKGQPVQIRPTSPDMLMRFRGRPLVTASYDTDPYAQPDPAQAGRVILNPDDFLYNVHGEPVARIMELEMIYHQSMIEVTSFGSSARDYIAGDGGGATINLRATGLPNTRLR